MLVATNTLIRSGYLAKHRIQQVVFKNLSYLIDT